MHVRICNLRAGKWAERWAGDTAGRAHPPLPAARRGEGHGDLRRAAEPRVRAGGRRVQYR